MLEVQTGHVLYLVFVLFDQGVDDLLVLLTSGDSQVLLSLGFDLLGLESEANGVQGLTDLVDEWIETEDEEGGGVASQGGLEDLGEGRVAERDVLAVYLLALHFHHLGQEEQRLVYVFAL